MIAQTIKIWFSELPGPIKVIIAIVVSAILLGAGVYDNREQTQENRERIAEVKDSLQKVSRGLVSLSKDTGDILCILIQDAGDDPLVCIEERRFNDLLRNRQENQ